jgi:glycosyltransferase involved in cell wall biosynthesis
MRIMDKDIYIVIAAYNEEKAIGNVLDDLKKSGYRNIVVVDDGSADRTADVSHAHGAHVLKHVINRGQGAGLKTGIDYALLQGAKIIVTFDADGQFLTSDIKKMVEPVAKGMVEMTLGSRFLGQAKNIPFLKKIALKLGTLFLRIMYGISVTDSQNGFRAMSRHAAQKIEITADRMEHASEILGEIAKKKIKFSEVPVTVIYSNYAMQKGQSWTRMFNIGAKVLLRKLMR